jgi:hypothetical protein
MPIDTWDFCTTSDGSLFAVRTANGITGVVQFSPQRITVELDIFDTETGEHVAAVSNVIHGDLRTFTDFADVHLDIAPDYR